jgi:hypothetical protein
LASHSQITTTTTTMSQQPLPKPPLNETSKHSLVRTPSQEHIDNSSEQIDNCQIHPMTSSQNDKPSKTRNLWKNLEEFDPF